MTEFEFLTTATVDDVVQRIGREQRVLTQRHPLISAQLDPHELATTLLASQHDVLVATRHGKVTGHLRGVTLTSADFGYSAWINPEGLSYDDVETLEALYARRASDWVDLGILRHYVWVPADRERVEPWQNLGFAAMHLRGSMPLSSASRRNFPSGYSMRRGSASDVETAIELDDILSEYQEGGPSFALGLSRESQRSDWLETLDDPDTFHVIVEYGGQAVAQALTFPVFERLGSFPASVHLSAVCVRREHRGSGVGAAMVDELMAQSQSEGFEYVETNWRVTNRQAHRFWLHYGFTPTYLRLHRAIGVG
ncbi:MAG: GNAT family N-acetyltransferase [Actinomycetota bacterium]|jgi:ribosomal protein S18 acetylase RimI-like enzyme